MRKQDEGLTSAIALSQYSYSRQLGAFKPKFQGIAQDYYPLTNLEVFKYTLFVVGIIAGVLGILIGFIFWVKSTNLSNYIIVWSIVTLCFIVIMMIMFYVGGKGRIRQQKQLIVKAQIRFQELKGKMRTNYTQEI